MIDDAKEEMRRVVLEELLRLPCVKGFYLRSIKFHGKLFRVVRTRVPVDDADSDGEITILDPKTMSAVIEGADSPRPKADAKMAELYDDKTVDLHPSVAIDIPQPSGVVSSKQHKIPEGKAMEISIKLATLCNGYMIQNTYISIQLEMQNSSSW